MKKSTILILLLFTIYKSNAQKVDVGFKVGLNISTLHIQDNQSVNSKVGLNLGMFFNIHASNKWALQPEFLYSMEGAKETINGSNSKIIYNLNYLNVPILLQRIFSNGFRLEGGPQIGFLLNSRTNSGNTIVTNTNFISSSLSIPLGVSYMGTNGVGLDARYVFGLNNINDPKNGIVIQSNVFQLGIVYLARYSTRH